MPLSRAHGFVGIVLMRRRAHRDARLYGRRPRQAGAVVSVPRLKVFQHAHESPPSSVSISSAIALSFLALVELPRYPTRQELGDVVRRFADYVAIAMQIPR